MSHVEFKKCPCRRVDLSGSDPQNTQCPVTSISGTRTSQEGYMRGTGIRSTPQGSALRVWRDLDLGIYYDGPYICHMPILRKANIGALDVDFKKYICRPVEFKKCSCCPVEFKKLPCPMSLSFQISCRMSLKPKMSHVALSNLGV